LPDDSQAEPLEQWMIGARPEARWPVMWVLELCLMVRRRQQMLYWITTVINRDKRQESGADPQMWRTCVQMRRVCQWWKCRVERL